MGGHAHRAGDVLALDRARRLQQHELVVAEPETRTRRHAIAGRGVEIEEVVNRGRALVAACLQLAPAAQVDRRVHRTADSRRQVGAEVREVPALPGEVVVAEQHAAAVAGDDARDGRRGVDVEGERAQVVDDHEVGAAQRGGDLGFVDRSRTVRPVAGRVDREARQHRVAGMAVVLDRAGHPADLEAELAQCPVPLPGLDRYAVGPAEAKRHDHRFGRHRYRR
jgi:hypothetical protein